MNTFPNSLFPVTAGSRQRYKGHRMNAYLMEVGEESAERAHGQVPHKGLLGAAALKPSTTAQHSRVGTGAIFRENVKLAVTGQHSGGGNSVSNHAAATISLGTMPTVGKLAGNFGMDQRN